MASAPRKQQNKTAVGIFDIHRVFEEAFSAHPFRIKLASKQQVQIVSNVDLVKSRDFNQKFSSGAEVVARRWVQTQTQKRAKPRVPPSVIHRQVQLDILKALHQSLSSKGLAPLSVDDEQAAGHIKRADVFVTNSIEKAKKQKYSIAFCGMVKAGYVK
jgi:hypothetical protein